MQHRTSDERVALDEVLITHELERRPARAPDVAAENRALTKLARELGSGPRELLQALASTVVECCRAESAGISILEHPAAVGTQAPAMRHFRWYAVAGPFAQHLGGSLPRDFSPCGIVIDRDEMLLFDRPARHFSVMRETHPQIAEALLAPFHVESAPVGTVWALIHSPDQRFDAEDARVLTSLPQFAAAGYQLLRALRSEQCDREALERRVRERTAELEQTYEEQRKLAGRLRHYARQLTAAEHRERKRIAAVLHDDLQQLLAAARMQLGRSPAGEDEHNRAGELIEQALSASRDLTERLRPPVFYEAGLLPALRWLAHETARHHGIQVELIDHAGGVPTNDDVSALLFESVRELLFNVAKYAGVDSATVEVQRRERHLRIVVADEGDGFDPSARELPEQPGGFGLFSVRERLSALGGRMTVDSSPGDGTTVTLEVPI